MWFEALWNRTESEEERGERGERGVIEVRERERSVLGRDEKQGVREWAAVASVKPSVSSRAMEWRGEDKKEAGSEGESVAEKIVERLERGWGARAGFALRDGGRSALHTQ